MRIHHVGVVVRSIAEHYEEYFQHLFPMGLTGVVHDPLQKVNVAFLVADGGMIELIEPAEPASPISRVLERNLSAYHHICLEVEDLTEALQLCRAKGQVIISSPRQAVAFENRRIAFLMGRDGLLWELLEQA